MRQRPTGRNRGSQSYSKTRPRARWNSPAHWFDCSVSLVLDEDLKIVRLQ